MKTIAFILINLFPAASAAIGVVLLILVVVMAVLLILKAREVAALKKEVFELRDTMRMMRYEEISLSRMLHTANKYVGPVEEPAGEAGEPAAEEAGEMVAEIAAGEVAAEAAEEPVVGSAEAPTEESVKEEETLDAVEEEEVAVVAEEVEEIEETEESAEEQEEEAEVEDVEKTAEELTEEPTAEPVVIEESIETIEPAAQEEEPVVESEPEPAVEEDPAAEEEPTDELVEVAEEPSVPQTHKQPINERRPAIPVDLFSAWFAENEDITIEETAVASSCESGEFVKTRSLAEVVSEAIPSETSVGIPVMETSVADAEESLVEAFSAQDADLETAPEAADGVELSKEDERFCRKLERIVSTRLRNPNLNIDIIAAQFGIGRTNFYRKVRELMGMSPNDYLRKCRMERAAELLRGTELPISDVCAQVGIPDAQYFSRVFKTFFGVTPSAYRENNNQ